MNANLQLLIARQVMQKRAFSDTMNNVADNWSEPAWNAIKGIGNFGSYLIPGVGSARMGYDSLNAFREGRPWAGVGNAIGAGLGLIPGVGGGLAEGGELLAGGAKALGMTGESMGGLAKTFGVGQRALSRGSNALQAGTSGLLRRLPGAAHVADSAPVKWMAKNPFKTMVGAGQVIPGVGLKPTFEHMQEASDIGKQMASGGGAAAAGGGSSLLPSARSLLGMAGFGGGEMDPRYMGGSGGGFNYNTGQPE